MNNHELTLIRDHLMRHMMFIDFLRMVGLSPEIINGRYQASIDPNSFISLPLYTEAIENNNNGTDNRSLNLSFNGKLLDDGFKALDLDVVRLDRLAEGDPFTIISLILFYELDTQSLRLILLKNNLKQMTRDHIIDLSEPIRWDAPVCNLKIMFREPEIEDVLEFIVDSALYLYPNTRYRNIKIENYCD